MKEDKMGGACGMHACMEREMHEWLWQEKLTVRGYLDDLGIMGA
jgi:hypothetical protein